MNEKVYSEFHFVGNSIRKAIIENNLIVFYDEKEFERFLDLSHEILSVGISDEGDEISGVIDLHIDLTIEQERKTYKISMTIEGCFTAPAEMGKDNFKEMLQINGLATLYSIARGYIQSISAQSLFGGVVLLPMLNVAEYSQNINGDD